MTDALDNGGPAPRRILFVLMGSIGDVIRALPLLGRVRRAWPEAHIAWAVEPKSRPLLEGHPWVDEIIAYDRARAPLAFPMFLRAIRAGKFDLVVDLQRHLKSGIASLVSGARERIGFARENTKEFNHLFSTRRIAPQPRMRLKLLQYQAFGDALSIPPAPIEFGLRLPASERERAEAMLVGAPRPMLGVILGSSWPSRIYFPEAIVEVLRGLRAAGGAAASLFPVLLGGPEEVELAGDVARLAGDIPILNLAGKTRLRDLFAIFPQCAVAFGPDSGPMHIAAAVGCPVVSLWGATAPERSAPWGFAQLVLRAEIPCHPCYLRRCPIGRECMRRILPSSVVAAIAQALSTVAAAGAGAAPAPAAAIDGDG
ncbi:MAG: glycosyltransferase family 9 protein [Candidatus Binataceae bacterium]